MSRSSASGTTTFRRFRDVDPNRVDLSIAGSFDETLASFDDDHVHAVPVTLSCNATTVPGQRVVAVGTWCDWDVEKGLEMTWSEGNKWVGTMPLVSG